MHMHVHMCEGEENYIMGHSFLNVLNDSGARKKGHIYMGYHRQLKNLICFLYRVHITVNIANSPLSLKQ